MGRPECHEANRRRGDHRPHAEAIIKLAEPEGGWIFDQVVGDLEPVIDVGRLVWPKRSRHDHGGQVAGNMKDVRAGVADIVADEVPASDSLSRGCRE